MTTCRNLACAFALLTIIGCGSDGVPALPTPDLAACAGLNCPCLVDADCPGGRCDQSQRCVACLDDRDCAVGRHCAAGACLIGCTLERGCGDAGVCEADAGVCVECQADHDCAGSASCCGDACRDLVSDGKNCGACGMACAVGSTCCHAGCTDLQSDPLHCGSCDGACVITHGKAGCLGGHCTVASCDTGYSDCDGDPKNGCETNTQIASDNCGVCGRACSQNHIAVSCTAGVCDGACNPGYADCNADKKSDGCETDIHNSASDCGGCGNACAVSHDTPTCLNGRCQIACDMGFGDCDNDVTNGCETALASSAANCGGCGHACASGPHSSPVCSMGGCGLSCSAGFLDCDLVAIDGCEKDALDDVMNCGACGHACVAGANASATCAMGLCGYQCALPFADCDGNGGNGCEVDTSADANNCGGCGHVCPARANAAATCQAGACGIVCANGFADCDGNAANGCEVNILTDTANCNGCGKVCPAGGGNSVATCNGGACGLQCNVGYADCDGNLGNGCESNQASDANNCGQCGKVCGGGSNPQCTQSVCTLGTCGSPYVLSPGGGQFASNMVGNSTTSGSCGGNGVDSYISWTPNKTGTATVQSVTDYWPAVLYARKGGCNGQELACQYQSGPWPTVTISFQVTAGTTYYIIPDHGSYNGNITLAQTLTYSVN